MTLEQYRALSKEEQELIMTTLQNMVYPVPNKYPFNYWDIEFYYKKRYKEREKNTNISWPANLSKKEQVICKIDMMRSLLEGSALCFNGKVQIDMHEMSAAELDQLTFINVMIMFCNSVEKEIYKHKSSIDGPKWPGIPSDAAAILNVLYKPLAKSFQKKYQV
jgi:hypothetical protein